MVSVEKIYNTLIEQGVDFFTGVPDSLLKDVCAYITDHASKEKNIIAANEGAAIGIAAGHYMACGRIPLVYMQNSGIGNAVNPLLSLMDGKVYQLPVLLLVGWRGEPGVKDEPQHIKQGEVTLALFDAMQIPYAVLANEEDAALCQVQEAITIARRDSVPYALIVRKDIFGKYELQSKVENRCPLSREEALKIVVDHLGERDIVVSTTGKLSRELYEYREALHQGHERDFLTVGSMGHSSSIALGIAIEKKNRNVYCLDGDGAIIMHMGALSSIGNLAPANFRHILFNNGAHESVGGQPTVGFHMDIPAIAQSCGYKAFFSVLSKHEIELALFQMSQVVGPVLLEIRVRVDSRDNLGRPTTTPLENKIEFMNNLK